MAENRGRGWNFKKGAKDVPSVDELRKRAGKGGKALGKRAGFSDKDTLQKAIERSKRTRQERASRKASEQESEQVQN